MTPPKNFWMTGPKVLWQKSENHPARYLQSRTFWETIFATKSDVWRAFYFLRITQGNLKIIDRDLTLSNRIFITFSVSLKFKGKHLHLFFKSSMYCSVKHSSSVSSFWHFLSSRSIDRNESVAVISLITLKLFSFSSSRNKGSEIFCDS